MRLCITREGGRVREGGGVGKCWRYIRLSTYSVCSSYNHNCLYKHRHAVICRSCKLYEVVSCILRKYIRLIKWFFEIVQFYKLVVFSGD